MSTPSWSLFPALLLATAVVWNGGRPRIVDRPMGEYRVSVFTAPTPPRPDSLDVSVLVLRGRNGRPAPEVEVRIEISDPTGRTPVRSFAATREDADDPRFHAVKFAPGHPGRWRVRVRVSGPGGSGEAAFDLEVPEPGLGAHPLLVLGAALLPLVLAALWLYRRPAPQEE